MKYLQALSKANPKKIGAKAANLKLVLDKTSLRVPNTLVLTSDFYQKIKSYNPIPLNRIGDPDDLLIKKEDWHYIFKNIEDIFAGASLVVRSSVSCEDSPSFSFAGQYSTFLNINTREQVSRAIKLCILSLYSRNSIFYARKFGLDLDRQSVSIMLQQLTPVDSAGVIFTADPTNDDQSHMLLEYTAGLGDKVVSGEKKPIFMRCKKASLPKEPLAAKVCAAALALEKVWGNPRDIEWGIADDHLYIFQSRPITTLNRPATAVMIAPGNEIILTGAPACRGVSEGNLHIVKDKSDLSKIKRGEIVYLEKYSGIEIVEHFNKIKGIISKGGVLSHIAVIAREYAMPAIAGVEMDLDNFSGKQIIINGFDGTLTTYA